MVGVQIVYVMVVEFEVTTQRVGSDLRQANADSGTGRGEEACKRGDAA